MLAEGRGNQPVNRRVEWDSVLYRAVKLVGKIGQAVRHRGVENDVRERDILRRANHSELELVAREGKGRGAVSVGRVLSDLRHRRNAEGHILFLLARCRRPLDDGGND